MFQQFYTYIRGYKSRAWLVEEDTSSRTTLWREFTSFFSYAPTASDVSITVPSSPWVLGIDGMWLHRECVFLVIRDITHKKNLWWGVITRESYEEIVPILRRVKKQYGVPTGIVSDWGNGIVAAVNSVYPEIPHQRCLAHIVRHSKTLLPARSAFNGIRTLRSLTKHLMHIQTDEDKREWLRSLIEWEKQSGDLLYERTKGEGTLRKWWYTHGNLRRAWRLLTDNWHPFFVYLTCTTIPRTNNSLEGVNRNLSSRISAHRGMQTPQQIILLSWYCVFQYTNTKKKLKQLWDIVKGRL